MKSYSFSKIVTSYNLKRLKTEILLKDVFNELRLIRLYQSITSYTELFFLIRCSNCETNNLPKSTFCLHCGDLLKIDRKYNICLGEYNI